MNNTIAELLFDLLMLIVVLFFAILCLISLPFWGYRIFQSWHESTESDAETNEYPYFPT